MDRIIMAAHWLDRAIWVAAPYVGFTILWLVVVCIALCLIVLGWAYWPVKHINLPQKGIPLWMGWSSHMGTHRLPITRLIGLQSTRKTRWAFGLILFSGEPEKADQ